VSQWTCVVDEGFDSREVLRFHRFEHERLVRDVVARKEHLMSVYTDLCRRCRGYDGGGVKNTSRKEQTCAFMIAMKELMA
jgi:hypothetical protein